MKSGHAARTSRALQLAAKEGYESLCATRSFNVYYLTGFWGNGIYTNNGTDERLFVSILESDRARHNSKVEVTTYKAGELLGQLSEFFGGRKVACDDNSYRYLETIFEKVNAKPTDILERVRSVKFDDEISIMKDGGKIMDMVYENALKSMSEGMRERDLYAKVVSEIIRHGGDVIPYEDTIGTEIVAFGENTSYPHYSPPSARALRPGDPVLMDLTLRYNGYIIDFTRTVFFKRAEERMEKIYNDVMEAQALGIKSLKPGMEGKELDNIVRESFGSKKDRFSHSLGHGVGVEVHERPFVAPRSTDKLERGSCITIEPGLYFDGDFGVRIEDSMIVDDLPVLLTNYPRELIII
ncbi:MAG: aminopeptidase P family protein [Nitrososphaerota archaeon]|nr:Xaa-Pro peptidase family protein [Nitrososphaerota archaeon]MDG6927963.1 aminopeptidase P family protein [Nitrososphaerota archaeon]MDG6929632.1 aminopeptidase P family protein [Nitrososphaerota archaeon]MDG6932859.1 aminopeptidase P family protein [Nitrososphaerota archaeon]MDG6936818.1 aminopeptidase P family protein [Nitrososphaerota archaeon]